MFITPTYLSLALLLGSSTAIPLLARHGGAGHHHHHNATAQPEFETVYTTVGYVTPSPVADSSAVVTALVTPSAVADFTYAAITPLVKTSVYTDGAWSITYAPASLQASETSSDAAPIFTLVSASTQAPTTSALPAVTSAAVSTPSTNSDATSSSDAVTAAPLEKAILAAAPGSSSCSGASFPDECRTSTQAAPAISNAFTKYGITSPKEQAALLALMLYESGEFKYNKNHWPGVPGQGTRNMQSPSFNKLYATSLFGADAVAKATTPDAVLALVLGDTESFASAAWFVTSQCSATIRQGLQAGTQAGWESYLSSCVGTTVNADRNAYWTKAVQALGS